MQTKYLAKNHLGSNLESRIEKENATLKISNWLLNYDQKFWSIVKDDQKRESYLNQLYRFRVASFSLLCFGGFMTFLGIVFDKGWFIGMMLILFIVRGMNYLDTDSKIRTIRLYELFSTENKKI